MPSPTARPAQIGKFRSSTNSAPVVGRTARLRKALALDSSPVTERADVDRPPDTVVAAKNVNELQGQIGQLIAAFQSSEKRDPGILDTGFWRAYSDLCRAYFEAAQPGSWGEF